MKRRLKDKRMPIVADRRLFGPHTCRIGGCGRDGTVGVDLPGVRYDYRRADEGCYGEIETLTRIYYCERHAKKAVTTGSAF